MKVELTLDKSTILKYAKHLEYEDITEENINDNEMFKSTLADVLECAIDSVI